MNSHNGTCPGLGRDAILQPKTCSLVCRLAWPDLFFFLLPPPMCGINYSPPPTSMAIFFTVLISPSLSSLEINSIFKIAHFVFFLIQGTPRENAFAILKFLKEVKEQCLHHNYI